MTSTVDAKHCSHAETIEERLQCAVDASKWNKAEYSSHEVEKNKNKKNKKKKAKKTKKKEGESFNEKYNSLADIIKKLKKQ